jgi:hypothetical protein
MNTDSGNQKGRGKGRGKRNHWPCTWESSVYVEGSKGHNRGDKEEL